MSGDVSGTNKPREFAITCRKSTAVYRPLAAAGSGACSPSPGPPISSAWATWTPAIGLPISKAAHRFGYELLWALVLSNAMALLLQTLSARLGIVTRRDLAQACRDEYPLSF